LLLFAELTDDQNDIVDSVWSRTANANELIIDAFNIPIKRSDLMRLKGLDWLNDEVCYFRKIIINLFLLLQIINFYMELIVDRSKHPQRTYDTPLPKVCK
jgi:Ulp1 family protease